MFLITDFGAEANGKLCTNKIQNAINKASENGGTVVVPAGIFLTSSLELKDNVELHLTPGAVLKFSDNQDDYPVVFSRWEGAARDVYASCLYADGAKNISVTGRGTLDGSGKKWWHIFRNDFDSLKYPRPKLISFCNCENVLLRDISCINSPSWTINPILCTNVTCDNLSILNPADSPNTDGIDPESCKNVRISNCNIDVGDDCIAIKAGTEDAEKLVPCENITITGCTMVHGHGGIVIGSEMSGGVKNVTVGNCVFQDTDRGIRLKSRRGRGGCVEDICVSNIIMDNVICPFIINLYYFCGPRGNDKYVWDKTPYPITDETPCFKRINFSNISARNVNASAGFIYGLAEQYTSEITFRDIRISMAEDAVAGVPAMMAGIEEMKQTGFYIGCAEDISFSDVVIENHVGSAFFMENTKNIMINNCLSKNPKDEGAPLIQKGNE